MCFFLCLHPCQECRYEQIKTGLLCQISGIFLISLELLKRSVLSQDWNDFLKTAAERSPLLHVNLEQEPEGSPEPTPVRGGNFTDLSSQTDDGAISYSPLVATDLLESESPSPLVCTPLSRAGCTHSSPLPQTPRMLSPPRSVRVLSTISESPLLSTPVRFLGFDTSDGNQEPKPRNLLTPEGSTHLVFETPLAQVTHHGQLNDLFFPHTPKFGVSPPRTCRPLRPGEALSTESDPTPVLPSPFRTPGKYSHFSLQNPFQ
jgi:hypothetical protein